MPKKKQKVACIGLDVIADTISSIADRLGIELDDMENILSSECSKRMRELHRELVVAIETIYVNTAVIEKVSAIIDDEILGDC